MVKYQEADLYLTKEGWIVGEIRNQDNQIIRQADKFTRLDYALKVTERTYDKNTTQAIDTLSFSTGIFQNISYKEKMDMINKLHNEYGGTRPYIPYPYTENN